MKYINSVMADYIKPFIYDQNKNGGFKVADAEEEKQIARSGMGDFDYEKCPMVSTPRGLTEKQIVDLLTVKTRCMLLNIDKELAVTFEEQKCLESKLTSIEADIQKRMSLYDMCEEMCKEESKELQRFLEKNEKIDTTLTNLQQMVESWQCLIDEFRKIPEIEELEEA